MRSTILLASEFGSGMGHARRLLRIAIRLKELGYAPVVALRDLWVCVDDFRESAIPVVQAPVHRSQWPRGRPQVRSYADLSAGCGFQHAEALWPPVLGWNALFDLLRPSAVIADYSPLISLAAFDRCPLVAIGDGFVLPPPHLGRMPVLRPEGTDMADESLQLENAALVQRRLGRRAPDTLPQLIGGQAHVVCTYPELDIYAGLRLREAEGALLSGSQRLPPASDVRLFLYLSALADNTREAISAVVATGLPVELYVRDLGEEDRRALQGLPLALHRTPPPLRTVLERCSLLIHHGGIGTMEACLAAGRPQLLLPSHFEQQLNAKNAVDGAIAFSLANADIPLVLADLAREVATGQRSPARLAQVADEIAGRPHDQAMDAIAAACRRLAG